MSLFDARCLVCVDCCWLCCLALLVVGVGCASLLVVCRCRLCVVAWCVLRFVRCGCVVCGSSLCDVALVRVCCSLCVVVVVVRCPTGVAVCCCVLPNGC